MAKRRIFYLGVATGLTTKEYNKKYHQINRLVVLIHYSGNPPKCQCCGMDIYQFLGIDHIYGRGSPQGTPGGNKGPIRGGAMYEEIIKQGFPPGLRVLCHNCNMAIGFYGKCPHEEQKECRKEIDRLIHEIAEYSRAKSSSRTDSESPTTESTNSAIA